MRYELTDFNGPLLFAPFSESRASAIFTSSLFATRPADTRLHFISKSVV
jgi:hypothetical protein